ncbi:class 3 adenylate cyclase/Tfp pilus assembly protein PilF [Lewinella marina]|uniref:Adenylate/guanylate cyclase domain-containing protein n=1 Tax=Neolewinella marina TaxID=438751 RepID=A0A2G0CAP7_9BACT|nr:adenylate/guanylate cyclase domain-containing protein [Neolewinella marina]NJB87834.1 class 3 adenylate cyclase/Tfp pilus assembly protein PilF [Neolewinella marina]PHK97046.1 adenylate/guanylate cyclase domain-containing protein [Neolewinella marina]
MPTTVFNNRNINAARAPGGRQLFLLILLFIGLAQGARAADPAVDSLRGVLSAARSDTLRLRTLLELSTLTFRSDPSSAIAYAEDARELAREIDDQTSLAYALKNIGLAHYITGDYLQVLENWQQSLDIFESINDRLGISNLTSNIGAVYFNQGDDPKALEYYLRSLQVSERINDSLRIATALNNIGAVYFNDTTTHGRALDYYSRALTISEQLGDLEAIATSAVNLGEIYLEQGAFERAILYFEKALAAYEQSGGNAPYALYNLGKTYAARGDYRKALEYHRRAFAVADGRDARLEMATALVGIGGTQLLSQQFDQAVETFKQALVLAREVGSLIRIRDAFAGLTEAYASQSDYREAYRYQSLLNSIRDTLYTIEKDNRIQGLQFKYDIEKKENEIAMLNKDNDLKEVQIQRAHTLRNFLFAIAFFLTLMVGGVFYQYRFAKKINRLIRKERNRSERILLNILPSDTAEELKQNGYVKAKRYERVTVLFTDFKRFTEFAENYPPTELVKSLDYYFRAFDEITGRYQLEKIKTIGDSYMCAGGLPVANETNPYDAIYAAFEMAAFVRNVKTEQPEGIIPFEMRIGLSTGPVVAGVVGTKKFQYDIWGPTVNIASRMETCSEPGRINISDLTYELVRDQFACTYRGRVEAKNGEQLNMYFVERPMVEDQPLEREARGMAPPQ